MFFLSFLGSFCPLKVRGGIAPFHNHFLGSKRYILAELRDCPASVHMDFLAQEQAFLNDQPFLHDGNDKRFAFIPDIRSGVDLAVDGDSLDFDFHRFERLFDQFIAFTRYCPDADAGTFHASLADFEFFFDDRNAYLLCRVFRCVGHGASPIRTGKAEPG